MVQKSSIEDLSDTKWAIMVCLDGKDDWIFVTEDNRSCDWNLQPMLFDHVSDALAFSQQWVIPGKEANVQVVNYES